MSVLNRVKRIEGRVEIYLEDKKPNGIVVVSQKEEGSYMPVSYHDYKTTAEIPNMADKVRACTNFDELTTAVEEHDLIVIKRATI